MSIFGSDFGYEDDLYVISGDLDMEGNRITDLKNPADSNDAVNKKYMNKRIEYKTKDLENKLSTLKSKIDRDTDDNLQRLRLFNASIQQNKEEISKLKTEIDTLEPLQFAGIENNLQSQITALQDVIYGTEALESDLNMGNNRIINAAHPRNPQDNADYDRDLVTAKFLYDYIKIADRKFLEKSDADRKYLKANEDNVVEGRLDMKQHKIIGLADPVNFDDAVTKRYVSSRVQALVDDMSEIRRRIIKLETH